MAEVNDVNFSDCDEHEAVESEYGYSSKDSDEDGSQHNERPLSGRDLSENEIRRLEFESELQACEFYQSYADRLGFVVRKDEILKDGNGNIRMRQLVCNKEGARHKKHLERVDRIKEHRAITRTGCPAKLRVHLDLMSQRWKVVGFVGRHNHDLTPLGYKHVVPANRKMTNADKAEAESLYLSGVRSCNILRYLAGQKGGYSKLGFLKKDLYNLLDRERRSKMKDGDAAAAMSYLQAKKNEDPEMFVKFTREDCYRLENLFWADARSRSDYGCFGDVLAFDTTYKKNKYNKPLVVFSGRNHHKQTLVFASALLSNETVETYRWVLETFLEAMRGVQPKIVITDSDGAMRSAIRVVFPESAHRLCAWHINKNAGENVKNKSFLGHFKRAMYRNLTEEEFEQYWSCIVERHNLKGHRWVEDMYQRKAMWASAFFRDTFCGWIRTTSQCEGLNAFISLFVQRKNSLADFLHNFDLALCWYRNNEFVADYNSNFTTPVLTTPLPSIEDCAAKVFTKEVFKDVKDEIVRSGSVNITNRVQKGNEVILYCNEHCNPDRQLIVTCQFDEGAMKCDCSLHQMHGIPCSHMFAALRYEHLDSIPPGLICRRWTKNAKSEADSQAVLESENPEALVMVRRASLSAACDKLCSLASSTGPEFARVREEIYILIKQLECRVMHGKAAESNPSEMIRDPAVARTKGAPSKRRSWRNRRCSNCRKTGHNQRACPQTRDKDDHITINLSKKTSPVHTHEGPGLVEASVLPMSEQGGPRKRARRNQGTEAQMMTKDDNSSPNMRKTTEHQQGSPEMAILGEEALGYHIDPNIFPKSATETLREVLLRAQMQISREDIPTPLYGLSTYPPMFGPMLEPSSPHVTQRSEQFQVGPHTASLMRQWNAAVRPDRVSPFKTLNSNPSDLGSPRAK